MKEVSRNKDSHASYLDNDGNIRRGKTLNISNVTYDNTLILFLMTESSANKMTIVS